MITNVRAKKTGRILSMRWIWAGAARPTKVMPAKGPMRTRRAMARAINWRRVLGEASMEFVGIVTSVMKTLYRQCNLKPIILLFSILMVLLLL